MAQNERVIVPDIGEAEAVEVVEVLVSVGSNVAAEESLITLESDKATMDVPSPLAGKVVDIKVKNGDRVQTGSLILLLAAAESPPKQPPEPAQPEEVPGTSSMGTSSMGTTDTGTPEPVEALREVPGTSGTAAGAVGSTQSDADAGARQSDGGFASAYASPAVRRFSRVLGVDLSHVRGTGRKGRILKEDVEGFVKKSLSGEAVSASGPALPAMPHIDFSKFGEVDRQPLTRIQRVSSANLHRSWLHVPHVTQHDEADITELEEFRKQNSPQAKNAGYNLTPVAFLMKASVAALEKYPRVNSSLDPEGEHVYLKKYFHLGIAVDTEEGLVVPVVRDVNRKGIFELAQELAEVSGNARDRKLRPDQIQGASFTITSLGGIGGTAFTPIVNAPEVAILGVSRAQWKPVWNGEEFVPRLMLPISFSYDHRVVDGALAVRFTTYLCSVLSDIRRLLL